MEKSKHTVSYTAEQLAEMEAKGADRTDWARVAAKTDAELAADTASDAAWRGIPEDWYKHARAASGPLMRPQSNKELVSVRYDADVIEFFRRSGRGWQSRMNAVLRSFMEQSERR